MRDVWNAVFGPGIPPEQVAKAAAEVGQVFGRDVSKTEAYGILAGVMPNGQPPKRGTLELMLLYAASPWLRAVVSRIAQRVAATEWEGERLVQTTDEAGAKLLRPRVVHAKALQGAIGHGVRKQIRGRYAKSGVEMQPILDHPALDFLRDGNPRLDGRACQQVTATHVLLKGEGYWLLERHESGPLAGLPAHYWPIPPYWIAATPTVTQPGYRVSFGGWNLWIPETEIVQFTDPDPFNPIARGVGLGESLGNELDSDEYAAKWIKARFFNQGVPATLVSLKGGSEDEAKRMKESWRQEFGGFMRQTRAYFTPREIQVASLEPKFEEMKLLELRASMRDAVLEVFGYPKELLGIVTTQTTRGALDTAEFRLEKYVVEPWREFFRHALQHRLMREWDERFVLDYVDEVPANREFLLSAAKTRPYAVTNNQFLEIAGLEPTDEPWGEERPPTPVTAPTEAEVIPTGGGLGGKQLRDPVWVRALPAARSPAGADLTRSKAQEEEQDDERAIADGAVDDVVDAIADEGLAPEDLQRVLEENVRTIGGKTMRALGLEASAFDHRDPKVRDWLVFESSDAVKGIDQTTRGAIRTALGGVANRGGSVRDAARAIREVFEDCSTRRAQLIAQTEMLRASGHATREGFKQSGLDLKKYWQHGGGEDDPRQGHVDLAEAEPIDLDEPFVNPETGVSMQFPGESGDPAEDCNCHCSHWAKAADPDKALAKSAPSGATLRAWRAPGIAQVAEVARKGFARQLQAALKALR